MLEDWFKQPEKQIFLVEIKEIWTLTGYYFMLRFLSDIMIMIWKWCCIMRRRNRRREIKWNRNATPANINKMLITAETWSWLGKGLLYYSPVLCIFSTIKTKRGGGVGSQHQWLLHAASPHLPKLRFLLWPAQLRALNLSLNSASKVLHDIQQCSSHNPGHLTVNTGRAN